MCVCDSATVLAERHFRIFLITDASTNMFIFSTFSTLFICPVRRQNKRPTDPARSAAKMISKWDSLAIAIVHQHRHEIFSSIRISSNEIVQIAIQSETESNIVIIVAVALSGERTREQRRNENTIVLNIFIFSAIVWMRAHPLLKRFNIMINWLPFE